MSESKPEMVDRVKLMAADASNEDWDFSPADTDALKYVLESREAALAALRAVIKADEAATIPNISFLAWGELDARAFAEAKSVIAEAEGN